MFFVGTLVGTLINIWLQRAGFTPSPKDPPGWWRRLPGLGNLVRSRSPDNAGWAGQALLELFTGVAFAGLYWWEVVRMGLVIPPLAVNVIPVTLHAQFAVHALLAALMIAATATDLLEQVIPDS